MGIINKKTLLDRRGFTLVELLIGIAVLGILMTAVFGIMSSSITSFRYDYSQTHNAQEARRAIEQIAEELRYAIAVDSTGFTAVTVSGPPTEYAAKADYLKYQVNIGGTAVTRIIELVRTSGSDFQTIVIQNQTSPATNTTYRFGHGISTALSFQRMDMNPTASVGEPSPVKIQVSLTMQDTGFPGGRVMTVSTDVLSFNMRPTNIVAIP